MHIIRVIFKWMLLLLLLAGATACMKWDYGNEESFHLSRRGLFITKIRKYFLFCKNSEYPGETFVQCAL